MSDTLALREQSLEVSKMFHEIKNPLTLINSSLQLIEDEHPEVREFRFWNQTIKDVQVLRSLINDMSSFQKCTFLKPSKVSLFDFLEDLLESTESYFERSGKTLVVENLVGDVDFYADELKMRQAVVNLLKNAVESTSCDSPIILILTKGTHCLMISVCDRGCGINDADISRIFEPYHTTKSYGTGLGLPIVKKIVDAHDGRLFIESGEGAGTTITIALPLL
jgi:signal transduction histidine kinase